MKTLGKILFIFGYTFFFMIAIITNPFEFDDKYIFYGITILLLLSIARKQMDNENN